MKDKERPFEQEKCPRCGHAFVCSTSAKCWCFEYDVKPDTMEMIQETWQGCLCPECLKSFSKQA
ncbi:MAG: cysteine-rich CWC family protein [Bacteroidota bacterium]